MHALPQDIVLLHDIWVQGDLKMLHDACRATLPHMHHFTCSMLGSNVAVLSRWPIVQVRVQRKCADHNRNQALTLPFQSQGNLVPMMSLDVLHGRAMCITQLAVAPGRTLTVINAVGVGAKAACAAARMAQATQLALTVRSLAGDVVVGGRLSHGRCVFCVFCVFCTLQTHGSVLCV